MNANTPRPASIERATAVSTDHIDEELRRYDEYLPQLAQLECRSHIFREAGVNGIIDLHCM